MNKESISQLSEPQRQSPVAIFTILYTFIRRLFSMFWIILVPLVVGGDRSSIFEISTISIVLAISLITVVTAILSYFKYYYFIDQDSFNIHKGVLSKTKVNLPFERIQNINFEQKIIHRIFGVVSLQIDSAGSAGSEIKIDALPKHQAEAIRDYILEQKREITANAIAEGEIPLDAQEAIVEKIPDELILSLSIVDLIKIGVSQNHIRTAFIIVGIGWGLMDNVEDIFKINFVDLLFDNLNFVSDTFLAPLIFLLIVSFVITLVRTVLRNFNLRFYQSQEGFKVNSGLFTRHEVSLRREKVQIIQWTTNPLRRLFKIFTLDIKQAVAGVVANRKQKAEVPGCYQHQVDTVLNSCFPDLNEDNFKEHRIDFSFVIRSFLYLGLIPMLILLPIYFFIWKINFLIAGIGLPALAIFFLWLYRKKYKVFIGEEYIKITKGMIGTSNAVLPYYKVQAIEIVQTIYQRRKGLGNVSIHTANGTLSIPYFDLEKAQALRNYVLYKVESSDKAWM
jgi:putative membrane protein